MTCVCIVGEKAKAMQMMIVRGGPATGYHAIKPFCRLAGEKKIAVGMEIEQDEAAIKLAVMQTRSKHGGHFDDERQSEWRAALRRHATAFSRRP